MTRGDRERLEGRFKTGEKPLALVIRAPIPRQNLEV